MLNDSVANDSFDSGNFPMQPQLSWQFPKPASSVSSARSSIVDSSLLPGCNHSNKFNSLSDFDSPVNFGSAPQNSASMLSSSAMNKVITDKSGVSQLVSQTHSLNSRMMKDENEDSVHFSDGNLQDAIKNDVTD